MARVTFKAAGAIAQTASSATLGIVAPTTSPGDLMLAVYHANDNLVVTLPSGWSLLGSQHNNTAAQTVLVAWKLAGTGDSAATFNFVKSSNNSVLACGAITTWSDPRKGNPFDSAGILYNDNASGDNCVSGAYTSAVPGRMIYVMFYGLGATTPQNVTGTNADGATITQRLDVEATLGITATLNIHQGSLVVPGAYGVGTIVSASTVDAISVSAVFGLAFESESLAGGAGQNGGVSIGPGDRGTNIRSRLPKLKDREFI